MAAARSSPKRSPCWAGSRGCGRREPGEFTRRAFENGRIDLAEAEGLADLLEAETESQRRAALALAGGALSRQVAAWQERILALSAQVEAALDFSDEDDVVPLPPDFGAQVRAIQDELVAALARPRAERLKDGIRVAIAGPPNAGKSSLLNALAGRDAAITSAIPGTTRDLVEAPTAIGGVPFLLIDTAGLRDFGGRGGIDRRRPGPSLRRRRGHRAVARRSARRARARAPGPRQGRSRRRDGAGGRFRLRNDRRGSRCADPIADSAFNRAAPRRRRCRAPRASLGGAARGL